MRNVIGLMLVFVLTTGTAFASLDKSESHPERGTHLMSMTSIKADVSTRHRSDDVRAEVRATGEIEREHGTATSSSSHDKNEASKAKQLFVQMHSVPGVVTSVSSNSFVMTIPAGKGHATTSVSVNVSASTKFWRASTTAALSDISVGTRVAVFGKTSSTTQSVAAERVIIGANMENLKPEKKNILDRFKHFFTGKHATTTEKMIEVRGGAAASMGSGIGSFFQKLFGWL